jgi:hypothetical protein
MNEGLARRPGAASRARCRALDSGHFLPEEAPEETYRELRALFKE